MDRRMKEQVVSDLQKEIEGLKAIVLTNFRGLNVEQMNQLRQRLREEKITYGVVKNTLIRLAVKGTNLEKLSDYFEGPTAIAVSHGDPIPLVKILTEFQKGQPALEIKAGWIEGQVASSEEVKALASMPSREVLMAQFLGAVQTPVSQFLGAMLGAFQEFLSVVQAREDQLGEQATKASNEAT